MKTKTWIILLCSLLCFGSFAQQGNGRKVLFIGDSLTDGGWGASGGKALPSEQRNHWDWNHLLGHGYMYLCAAHYMGHEPQKELQFFNRGNGGDKLQDIIDRWQKDCIDIHPDVVSILIGVNDAGAWERSGTDEKFDIKDWEKRYEALIATTRQLLPGTRIVLCTPFVVNSGNIEKNNTYALYNETCQQMAKVVRKLCKKHHLVCVEFDKLFENLATDYPTIPLIHWSWDGIHPTPAGHQLMADLWIKTVGL